MITIQRPLKTTIQRSPEFERKGLATHAVNVGLLCGHKCTYCSTPAMIRTHSLFNEIGYTAFGKEVEGISHIDTDIPTRLEQASLRLKSSDVVMLSTISDGWSPEAKAHDLGRQCLEKLLKGSQCQVRILTKNASITDDFDLMAKFRDSVLVGISITGPIQKTDALKVIEPYASPIEKRIEAIKLAQGEGLRTYGMLCPCLPGISDDPDSLREMLSVVLAGDPEGIWVEPVNPRGNGLIKTEQALSSAGFLDFAARIHEIRNRRQWSGYVRRLAEAVHGVAGEMNCADKIRFLLYGKGMQEEDRKALQCLPGIVWLN